MKLSANDLSRRARAVTDSEREAAIKTARRSMLDATDRESRMDAWEDMKGLVLERSEFQVTKMEKEAGLCR